MLKLVISILLFSCASAQLTNDYISSLCSNTSNYTTGSMFEKNMKVVFANLMTDAPPSGFSNTTTGQWPYEVYGLAQCRGDITSVGCRECIDNATINVVNQCPYSIDAIIWYEQCQLRYSNESFFGVLNLDDVANWYYTRDVDNPVLFGQKLDTLLNFLSSAATASASLFATGNIVYEEPKMIYGLAQCTRDTSVLDCNRCLGATITETQKYFGTKAGGEFATGSCRIRFGVTPFYVTPSSASPPPLPPSKSPPPPPRPSPHPRPNTGKPNNSRANSVAMITVITFALISTCWLLLEPSKFIK